MIIAAHPGSGRVAPGYGRRELGAGEPVPALGVVPVAEADREPTVSLSSGAPNGSW